METLDAIVNKIDFFKGEFVKGYHDADMLEMCLGRLCHFVDYDQTSIEDAGSEEDRGRLYHCYDADVYLTRPVDWGEMGDIRWNRPDGVDILIHDSEEGDPDNLVRLTFRFQKPTGLRYD